MKNNNIIAVFLILFLIISCSNERQEKKYYENGNLKSLKRSFKDFKNKIIKEEYDSLGKLTLRGFYTDSIRDSLFGYNKNKTISFKKYFKGEGTYSKEYDEKGNLQREGIYVYDTIKADWWKFYKNRKLRAKRQYEIVCDDYYLNQEIFFEKNRDTIFQKDDVFNASTFFEVKKVDNGKSFILYYNVKSLFKNNKLDLIILKDTYCLEHPDTVIALNANRGHIILDKKYFNKECFFFDYYTYKNKDNAEAPYGMKNHKKYFDLSKVGIVSN